MASCESQSVERRYTVAMVTKLCEATGDVMYKYMYIFFIDQHILIYIYLLIYLFLHIYIYLYI